MESLNYFILPFQSNVYGLSCLQAEEGHTKVLIATVERQIFCVEYNNTHKATFKEVSFTYIPNGADIISIDSFKRSNNCHDYVVGITFVKPNQTHGSITSSMDTSSESNEKYYFNIYASWVPLQEFNIDYIAQGCLTLEIDFVPYHLYHTSVFSRLGINEFVWLLCGSDGNIHCFREHKERQCFAEESIENYFPEFVDVGGIILWMDVYYIPDNENTLSQRLSALGGENGALTVCLTKHIAKSSEIEVTSRWTAEFDGPIPSVRFFVDRNSEAYGKLEKEPVVNLLVVNSLETSVVFRDLLKNGLQNIYKLPDSKRVDCSVTSCIADIDLDSFNELAIGTFGHELITYKFNEAEDRYIHLWTQLFSRPLQALSYADITGDGLKELLVLTNKGLHVLQHNFIDTQRLLKQRIRKLLNFARNCDSEQREQLKDFLIR